MELVILKKIDTRKRTPTVFRVASGEKAVQNQRNQHQRNGEERRLRTQVASCLEALGTCKTKLHGRKVRPNINGVQKDINANTLNVSRW